MALAFAQSGTGAQGLPGGAGTGGESGTGAPLTGGGLQTAPMKSGNMAGSSPPATSTENKLTASGGQPSGNASTGR